MTFKVGDIVTAFGLEGVVTDVKEGDDRPVKAILSKTSESFLLDGKLWGFHAVPSLKLVKRAEEFEEVVGYVGIEEPSKNYKVLGDRLFNTKEDALACDNVIGYREVKYMRRKV